MPTTTAKTDTHAQTPAAPAPRWGPERRLEFIDFRLRWDGRFNRSDLTQFFGISVPQSSLDIAKYIELAPNNLAYDRRSRSYIVSEKFRPVFPSTDKPSRYLNELLAMESGVLEQSATLLGWTPPVGLVPTPGRTLDVRVLATLLKAIRERAAVDVVYQSMSRAEPTKRRLSPHAIAHDGFRWHVRAFCDTRKRFLDFVIARMLDISLAEGDVVSADEDVEWTTVLKVVLVSNPALSKPHRKAVELDYGMTDGRVVLECRRAMLFYFLQHLGLDHQQARPEAQQVVLKNKKELAPFLSNTDSDHLG
jgi:hypothetical protein